MHLRTRQDWLPARLLGLDQEVWPSSVSALLRLRDAGNVLRHAPDRVGEGSPIVLPADVDETTGAPSSRPARRATPAWRVGGDGLRTGDLLVPLGSSRPVLLVRADYSGLNFAPTFIVVRPSDGLMEPEIMWAILNSTSGQRARATRTGASDGQQSTDLLNLQVPIPPLQQQRLIASRVAPLRASASPTDAAIRESWWKTTSLRSAPNWSYLLSSRLPVDLSDGTRLAQLAGISAGRRRAKEFTRAASSLVPLLRHRDLIRGDAMTTWVAAGGTDAVPGDIVFSAIRASPNAVEVSEECAIDDHLILVRPHLADQRDRIRRSLNSERGCAVRSALSTGTTLARLSIASAGQIPIASSDDSRPALSPEPLSVSLERLLWS